MKSKKTKLRVQAVIGLGLLWAVQGAAISPSNFICTSKGLPTSNANPFAGGNPNADAEFIRVQFQNCGNGQIKAEEDICRIRTHCLYVDDETKSMILGGFLSTGNYEKFSDLPVEAAYNAVLNYYGSQNNREKQIGLPTDLTCKAIRSEGGGLACPAPEACKNGTITALSVTRGAWVDRTSRERNRGAVDPYNPNGNQNKFIIQDAGVGN